MLSANIKNGVVNFNNSTKAETNNFVVLAHDSQPKTENNEDVKEQQNSVLPASSASTYTKQSPVGFSIVVS